MSDQAALAHGARRVGAGAHRLAIRVAALRAAGVITAFQIGKISAGDPDVAGGSRHVAGDGDLGAVPALRRPGPGVWACRPAASSTCSAIGGHCCGGWRWRPRRPRPRRCRPGGHGVPGPRGCSRAGTSDDRPSPDRCDGTGDLHGGPAAGARLLGQFPDCRIAVIEPRRAGPDRGGRPRRAVPGPLPAWAGPGHAGWAWRASCRAGSSPAAAGAAAGPRALDRGAG